MTFLTILGVIEILFSFRLVLEEKTDKKIRESLRLESLEKFLGNIADLPLLRTLLAIRQKSQEPSFWEVMGSFVLVAYASLVASRTLLPRLLAYLKFTLD